MPDTCEIEHILDVTLLMWWSCCTDMAEVWSIRSITQTFAILFLYYVSVSYSLLPDDVRQEILDAHNTLRRNFAKGAEEAIVANMKKLVWSENLERRARRKLRIHCRISYVAIQDSDPHSNFARNSNGDIVRDIRDWYSEIEASRGHFHISDGYGFCFPEQNCRRATTVLNANYRKVGCAYRRRCYGNGAFLCLYENDIEDERTFTEWGQFYTEGPVCSKCSNYTSFCDDGLCTSCDTSSEVCDCRKSCSSPGIGVGTLDPSTCTCNCRYGMGTNCDQPCIGAGSTMFEDYDICTEMTRSHCDELPELYTACPLQCGSCTPYPDS